jgi:hypothetical protein
MRRTRLRRLEVESHPAVPVATDRPPLEPVADMVPSIEKLPAVFGQGETALRGVTSHALQSGVPSPGAVTELFKPVKEAMNALSSITGAGKGPVVGVKVEGEGPNVSVQANVTFSF